MSFGQYLKSHYKTIALTSYLLPILLAVTVSLVHVVTLWNIANPMGWAIFLSIAIEIAVLSSIAASRISNWAWLPFTLVTVMQVIGNVFSSYVGISLTDPLFKSWVELVDPLFNFLGFGTDGDPIVHKRIAATLLGTFVPLLSIISFQFFIKQMKLGQTDDAKERFTANAVEITTDAIVSPISEIEEPEITVNAVTMQEIAEDAQKPTEASVAIENMASVPREKLTVPYRGVDESLGTLAAPDDVYTPERDVVTKEQTPEIAAYYEDPNQLKLFDPNQPPAESQDRIIVIEGEKKK